MKLAELDTPCLLLDRTRVQENIRRMRDHVEGLGTGLRPHIKTTKSREVTRLIFDGGTGPLTVSTLREAEYFADGGFDDIMYAVGIAPSKLKRAAALMDRVRLKIITDSPAVAGKIGEAGEALGVTFRVLVEIDSDGHRAGLRPDDPAVIEIARNLASGPGARLAGVMTHAGASYNAPDIDTIKRIAAAERQAVVDAAEALRAAGFDCPIVSVGSTPTATFTENLGGVTEVRAGCFVFQDLMQATLGVAAMDDIALSVLTEVIGTHAGNGLVLTDAGGLALSKDRGFGGARTDYGYGQVCEESGQTIAGWTVGAVNQEHGMITPPAGAAEGVTVGDRLRVLPNHACMTAAAYERYYVTDGGDEVVAVWERCNGW